MSEAYRLVIATVSEPRQVLEAIEALQRVPIGWPQICCAGTGAAMDGVRASLADLPGSSEGLVSTFGRVEPLMTGRASSPLYVTSNRFMSRLNDAALHGASGGHGDCWLSQAQRSQLVNRLSAGDIAMLVSAPSHRDWRTSTEILLSRSSSPVQGVFHSLPHRT